VSATVQHYRIRATVDFHAAFDAIIKTRANALLVFPDSVTLAHRQQMADFAAKHRLPGVFGWREYVEAGGLMAYGPNSVETAKRLAVYVDRILKGAKPGDSPVEQPSKFELVINLKTAMALGITIPPAVLGGRTTSSIRHARPTRQPLRAAVVCEFRAQPSQSHVVALPRCFPES